jgi:hypothetical protein
MRHLNKIIFINSANIPYAEIMLDGNVHFAGTQGVGKSTALRAILFFYTADKMHLGIQQGQKPFEEFYFPKSNSYIVYEVKTDYGFYSVMLSRSQGRPVFRFIDAPFQKEWIVSDDRRAENDWTRIRERIGSNVDISTKIDTYELYRNIIFGNIHDPRRRFDKYAIVESPRYRNIPRSIQNVFLNSKLDADFVKNTIIQSMTDIEDSINLGAYRPQVAEFEKEFDEISCWFRKEANGEIPVRVKANRVIDIYRTIVAIQQDMLQTWHRLNFSVNSSRERIPFIQDKINDLKASIGNLDEKLESNQKDYTRTHDSLKEKIGEFNARLKDIRNKRKHYAEMGIESIIKLDSKLPMLQSEKIQKEKLLKSLEEHFGDITEKYNKIRETSDAGFNSFVQIQTEELQKFRDQLQSQRDSLANLRDKRKAETEQAHAEWMAESDLRMDALRAENVRTDKRLSELKSWHPMSREIGEAEKEIRNLGISKKEYEGKLSLVTNELESIYGEAGAKEELVTKEYAFRQESLINGLADLETEINATKELLSRWEGSLYQWLCNNKPGWENNIGKVVDERSVLYASGLSPALSDYDGFFGIKIDLDAIAAHHRTPDDYRRLLKEKTQDLENKKREMAALEKECQDEIAAIAKTYKNKIAEKKQQQITLSYNLELIPQKMKDAETKYRILRKKEEELIEAEKDKRTSEHNDTLLNLDREKRARERRGLLRDKEFKRIESDYNSALKEGKKQLESFRKKQEEEKADKVREITMFRESVARQEHEELKGVGADIDAIKICRRQIEDLKTTIDRIEEHKPTVYAFRKDEKELFSRETEFKDEKQKLEAKDESISKTYEDRRKKLVKEKSENVLSVGIEKKRLDDIHEGLKQYDQLCNIENIISDAFLHDDREEKNDSTCSDLVGMMRGTINKERSKHDELKRAVNSFNSHFTQNNTFHFIFPQYDEEYITFAVNLLEFLDNNKIEDYRHRLSDHYSNILGSISREMGMLMNHTSEIRGIINEVNSDFRERNFAGVIRGIELRAEESSDRMMQLLRSIHDFTQENMLSLGEINLFSDGDTDRVNLKVIDYLKKFMTQLQKENSRTQLTLSDTFTLKFRVRENDNDTGWVERISNVGSDGTDILVKAMVNIMLINVFKKKASRKNGDFIIHCMMDEIGKLHPSNVAGILQFANVRNIYLINSSPMGYNADIYKYNYLLKKDGKSQTLVKRLLTINI